MNFGFKILVFLLLTLEPFGCFGQRNTASMAVALDNGQVLNQNPSGSKDLVAGFITLTRFGSAPLTVQFKDISQGQPTGWNWNFGDGTSDTLKNPEHTYSEPGNYTVKLSVTNSTSSSSLTRNNYIVVAADGACDTLAYPLIGDYALYIISDNGAGYVSGNNSYGDLAKASYFGAIEPQSTIIGCIFDFAIAKRSLASDQPIKFKVWESNGTNNSPGTLIAQQVVSLSQIADEVSFGWPSIVFFDEPPSISNPFFAGVELPQNAGDTLALYTNLDGDVVTGNGWEQHDNGNWYPYSNSQFSWGIDIDHAIFPLICQATGISNHLFDNQVLVYPIPANDRINVTVLDASIYPAKISVIDLTGRTVLNQSDPFHSSANLNVSHLKSGIYLLKIESGGKSFYRKIMIDR